MSYADEIVKQRLFSNQGDVRLRLTRTVFLEENLCPPTSLNRHIVKIDCIYNKLKITIYLYVSLVKIHPFLNEIGC